MKSFTIVALSTLALASQVAAQIISYSAPIAATQWTAGKPATISWTNSCNQVEGNTTFPVYLNQQVGQYQVQVPGIPELGYLDCKKPGKITVQVPATLPQGNAYSILVTNGNQSYSALFTILSTIPGSTTVPLPTTTTTPPVTTPSTTVASITTTTTSTSPSATPNMPNHAGALKAGSQAALVVVAAVASLLL